MPFVYTHKTLSSKWKTPENNHVKYLKLTCFYL